MHEIQGSSDAISRRSGCLSARFTKGFIQAQLQQSVDLEAFESEAQKRLVFQCNGFRTELGLGTDQPLTASSQMSITDDEAAPVGEWYTTFFVPTEHTNYTSRTPTEGDVVISVMKEKDNERNSFFRALFRSRLTTTGVLIPAGQLRSGIRRKTGTLNVS